MSLFCSFWVSNLRKFTLALRLYWWSVRFGFTFLFLIHLEGCVFFFSLHKRLYRVSVFIPHPRFIMSLPTHFINNPFIFIELNCPPCHTWICHIQRHLILGSLLCSTNLSIPLSKLNWLMILQDIYTIQKNKTHIQTKNPLSRVYGELH